MSDANSAAGAFSITPHDTNELQTLTRGLYVGGAGDAVVQMANGDQVTLVGLLAGNVYPIRCKKVLSTGTTATDLVGLF